ncbi:general substrate transporter [Penicillium waksmanii]|uniref:general substrate transporter n=1 Tax=Penicillium waksmanii TaxID=69791 RepID=UPI0025497B1D|nr:general substrate transporter [Penicillium waksmanii]KAJ5988281.1 general substrate transporter [Penicillium waksmanii]
MAKEISDAQIENANHRPNSPSDLGPDPGTIQGRAIQQQEHNRGYLETLKKDPWLLFWIGVMLWTLIVRGFENQSSGSVISIPDFKQRFGQLQDGEYFIETKWQSALSGGSNAAAIVGSWAASYFADKFGVKPVILVAAAINIASVGPFVSAIMSYYTSSWEGAWSWKSLICAQWGFAVVGLVGQIFMPESPVYLVRRGKFDQARKSLNQLYSDPHDAEGHLQRIKLTLEEAETQQDSVSYTDCFRGTNLRRTMIAIMVFLSEPMSGLGFVSNYGALMYQYLGIGDQQSFLIQIGAQILSMSGATISFLIGDMFGRRPMYLGGCIGLTLLLLCMGIAGSVDTNAATTAAVGFYTMYNFFYNAGVGSNVYTIAGEVPTSVLRTKTLAVALSVSAAVNTMWSFVAPYMFNPGYGGLKAKIGFVFGAFMLLFAVMAYFFVPETRRRTYEELDELFMNRVPTREFREYVTLAERRAAEAYQVTEKVPEAVRV